MCLDPRVMEILDQRSRGWFLEEGERGRREVATRLWVKREMKPQMAVLDPRGRIFHRVPGEYRA